MGHKITLLRSGEASVFFAFFHVSFLGVLLFLGIINRWVLGVYIGASLLSFLLYAIDKSAAINNRWRIQENTLHILAIAGGWPGATLAQQFLRHKTRKSSFRFGFWFTVFVNICGLLWLITHPT